MLKGDSIMDDFVFGKPAANHQMNRTPTVLRNSTQIVAKLNLSFFKQTIIKFGELTVLVQTDLSKETKRYSKQRYSNIFAEE